MYVHTLLFADLNECVDHVACEATNAEGLVGGGREKDVRCVQVASGIRLSGRAQKTLQVCVRGELAGVDERGRRHILGYVWGTAVDRDAAGEKTLEDGPET